MKKPHIVAYQDMSAEDLAGDASVKTEARTDSKLGVRRDWQDGESTAPL